MIKGWHDGTLHCPDPSCLAVGTDMLLAAAVAADGLAAHLGTSSRPLDLQMASSYSMSMFNAKISQRKTTNCEEAPSSPVTARTFSGLPPCCRCPTTTASATKILVHLSYQVAALTEQAGTRNVGGWVGSAWSPRS